MKACADIRMINREDTIQKRISLLTILDNVKYMNDPDIVDSDYRPLEFTTFVRTCYTNKVLVYDNRFPFVSYFYNTSFEGNIESLKGSDLLFYSMSQSLLNSCRNTPALNEVMMQSQISPLGLYFSSYSMTPQIISQIVIKDELLDNFQNCLDSGYSMKDISSLENFPLRQFSDTMFNTSNVIIPELLIVEKKGGTKSE